MGKHAEGTIFRSVNDGLSQYLETKMKLLQSEEKSGMEQINHWRRHAKCEVDGTELWLQT
jgi:hypothetical protein